MAVKFDVEHVVRMGLHQELEGVTQATATTALAAHISPPVVTRLQDEPGSVP
jgi:hypothetical protein